MWLCPVLMFVPVYSTILFADHVSGQILLQAYPQAQGSDSDLLVANEIAAHSSLQLLPGAGPSPGSVNIAQLLGTMDKASGGQVETLYMIAGYLARDNGCVLTITIKIIKYTFLLIQRHPKRHCPFI